MEVEESNVGSAFYGGIGVYGDVPGGNPNFQNSALPLIYSLIPSIPDIRSNAYAGLI